MRLAPFAASTQEGGRRLAAVCTGEAEGKVTGSYFNKGAATELAAVALDEQLQQQLWEQSMRHAGIVGPYVPAAAPPAAGVGGS
jgi:hypothetical protein